MTVIAHTVEWADIANGRHGPAPERSRPTRPPADARTMAEVVKTMVLLDVDLLIEGMKS